MDGGQPARTGSALVVAVCLSVTALVVVNVVDVDDCRPIFTQSTYEMSVEENSAVGVVVGHVTAVDQDLSPFNAVFYQLMDGDGDQAADAGSDVDEAADAESFHIDTHNGTDVSQSAAATNCISWVTAAGPASAM